LKQILDRVSSGEEVVCVVRYKTPLVMIISMGEWQNYCRLRDAELLAWQTHVAANGAEVTIDAGS
jgi:hypothetical protein